MDEKENETDESEPGASSPVGEKKQSASGANITQIDTVSGGTVNIQQLGAVSTDRSGFESEEAVTPEARAEHAQMLEMRQMLLVYFDDSELRDLCFDLDVTYEDLPGQGRKDKARELVAYLDRRGRSPELAEKIEQLRPDAFRNQSDGPDRPGGSSTR